MWEGATALFKTVSQTIVCEHFTLAPMVKRLTLGAPAIARVAKPGQFVHLRLSDGIHPLLRRPLSIAEVDREVGNIVIIYRVVGQGTAILASLPPGEMVDCMGPLGNGFDMESERPLLVGGGMGLAPLLFLAKELCPKPVTVLMGGRTKSELYWRNVFLGACRSIHVTTDDGSLGRRGFNVDLMPELLANCSYDRIYACGPRAMMTGVARLAKEKGIPCQISLEDHMACGVGACLSCTCAGTDGRRRKVCSDGPIFWAEEVLDLSC
jgi:dihydroorotate dehydrogenase electron transfer subunit